VKPLIELTDATRTYDRTPALNGVTLTVRPGEFVAVMGPSGSGKSTLLNLIAGLDRPSRGTVVVDGTDLVTLGEGALARWRRTRIGLVFQFFNLLDSLTVAENVLLPAQLAGVRPRLAGQRAQELLARLGLAGLAEQRPTRLSGGERQRVAVARALVNRPALLLADEPTGALDSRAGEQVMTLLGELHADGQTVLLVTHDAKLAAAAAGRVVSLRDGRVLDDARLASATGRQPPALVRMQGEAVPSPRQPGRGGGCGEVIP
jgi:putative ABC transport system ATP-binding protein